MRTMFTLALRRAAVTLQAISMELQWTLVVEHWGLDDIAHTVEAL